MAERLVEGLKRAFTDHSGLVFEAALGDVVGDVVEAAPRREGTLASSIEGQRTGELSGVIRALADHAEWVEKGSDEVVITPKRGQFLRFEIDGEVIYAREVTRPAIPANPFFFPTIAEKWPERLQQRFAERRSGS